MTEQQLLRQAKRRLAILQHAEEVTGNVARTCRYWGISRTASTDGSKRSSMARARGRWGQSLASRSP